MKKNKAGSIAMKISHYQALSIGIALLGVFSLTSELSTALAQCEQSVLGSPTPQFSEGFGESVAMDGNLALVGVPRDYSAAPAAGAAYLYRFDGSGWVLDHQFLAPDANGGDVFGSAVAILGDVVAIGAPSDDVLGVNSGSVYVFRKIQGVWQLDQKLVASDGAVLDNLGFSIDLGQDVLIASAPFAKRPPFYNVQVGTAYVFRYQSGAWSEEAKLLAPDSASSDFFGIDVALLDDTVLIGAHFEDPLGIPEAGSAYVFRHSAGNWTFSQKLTAFDFPYQGLFGRAVALHGDRAAIGCTGGWDDSALFQVGAVYLYRETNGQFVFEQKVLPPDGTPEGGRFGDAIDLTDRRLIVGAEREADQVLNSLGAAYVFENDGLEWTQTARLTPTHASNWQEFGMGVATHGPWILVGHPGDDPGGVNDAGSASIFAVDVSYGDGCDGAGGFVPHLRVGGCSRIGTTAVLELTQAVGGVSGFHMASLASANQPIGGCTLLLGLPLLATVPFVASGTPGVPGEGTATFPVPIPNNGTLTGLSTFFQSVVFDASAPQGVVFSNGTQIILRP